MTILPAGAPIYALPSFADGLDIWSSGDGRPGSVTYDAVPGARRVEDPDFGPCLEIEKREPVQKLRYMGETPILPGRYLRLRVRVKTLTGPAPGVRIAGWAGRATSAPAPVAATAGPVVQAVKGAIVEAEAILGTGPRLGVAMVWGEGAVYGHLGLDLTGAVGGTVRIADPVLEDVSHLFLREQADCVDPRDHGAVGDGVQDDAAAFEAADRAAQGRTIWVPEGLFRLGRPVTLASRVRFAGMVAMDAADPLVLCRNLDLATYADAMGDPTLGFRKAFQALMSDEGPDRLDLCGLEVPLDGPLDLAAISGRRVAGGRRVIRNGSFTCRPGPGWQSEAVETGGRTDAAAPARLTGLAARVPVPPGALAEGEGLGREIYVRREGAGEVELGQPPRLAETRGRFRFRRFRFALDFSGFARLSDLCLDGITVACGGAASAVLLAAEGAGMAFRDCRFEAIGQRGVVSPGNGCAGLRVEGCLFEAEAPGIVGLAVNAGGSTLRDNRFDGAGLGAILRGGGHLVSGNRFVARAGRHTVGLVFAGTGAAGPVTDNRFEGATLEWTNEHDPEPARRDWPSFSGLAVTGNAFAAETPPDPGWIVVRPHGGGHELAGMSVTGNSFSAGPVWAADARRAPLGVGAVALGGNVIGRG